MSRCLAAAIAASCFILSSVFAWAVDQPANATTPVADPEPRIVNGVLLTLAEQRLLGLVTVGGGCSGVMLNTFWVLTASHCLGVGGAFGGPDLPFTSVPITATWSARTAIPTRFVRYFNSDGVDVALVFLGNGDLGPVQRNQRIAVRQAANGAQILKYGRGISIYAIDRDPPLPDLPAVADGRYRRAQFPVSLSGAATYTNVATSNQVANGGDSGGPDFLIENGIPSEIVGVQSTCHNATCVAGQTCFPAGGGVIWTWVTNIGFCRSATLFNIRQRIISEVGFNMAPISYLLNPE